MYKMVIDKEKCKGCELCIGVCPKKILYMAEDVNESGLHYVEITDEEDCIGCKSCGIMCPDSVFTIYKRTEEERGGKNEKKVI